MPEEPIGNERIVLVHGAMHGAWCWEKIVPLLAARGRRVVAIDLPGLGDDPADPDTVTFEDYVNRIVETVEAEPGRVVLVGHSMGGNPITQAAEVFGDRVARLVYLAAILPIPGDEPDAVSARIFASDESLIARAARASRPGYLDVDPDMAASVFYNTSPPEDAQKAVARLRPQSQAVANSPTGHSHAVWGAIPKSYILCLQDRGVPPSIQRWMCERVPGITIHELDQDHSPFYSAPEALADILAKS